MIFNFRVIFVKEKIVKMILNNYYTYYIYMSYKKILTLFISDKRFRMRLYKENYGRELDLKQPLTFNGKIHKRTLYQRDSLFTKLADKYLVRDYVEEKIGSKYLIPLITTYKYANDICLDELPREFVMKCNHDAGSVLVCNDKHQLSNKELVHKYKIALLRNMYYIGREWHYKDIKPMILVEEKIDIFVSYNQPEDYKFHCFNGKVKYIEVQFSRFSLDRRINIYDRNWNLQPFLMGYKNSEEPFDKPSQLKEMINIVEILSDAIDYCRVDLYLTKNGKIYFGEMTFTPCNGLDVFVPNKFDFIFGKDWEL